MERQKKNFLYSNNMKLKLIESELVMKIASWFSGSNIIGTQFAFWLFVDDIEKWKKRPLSLNHEYIHFEQGKELLFIGFWFLYGLNYLINLFRYKFDTGKAYRMIVFEQEAYDMQSNPDYLSKRVRYNWIAWLF